MQRREMLAAVPALAATAATNPLRMIERSGYQPVGYVNAWGPGIDYVKAVTVDGVEIPNCDEANDAEGWAMGHSPRMYDKPFVEGVRQREFSELGPEPVEVNGEKGHRGTFLRVRYEGDVRIILKDSVAK